MSQPLEGHTIHRYDGELNHLHTLVLEMGGLALDQVNAVLRTISEKNLALAHLALKREPEIDHLELKIDNEITTIIARRSPVASDLRVTMSFSKAVTDLERIGDEAARMADIILKIYENDASEPWAAWSLRCCRRRWRSSTPWISSGPKNWSVQMVN